MSSKFFYSSLKKNQKDSNDFLPRKLNLEVKFWHFLTPTHKTMILFDYSWLLDKDLSNFVSLPWKLHNRKCHTAQRMTIIIIFVRVLTATMGWNKYFVQNKSFLAFCEILRVLKDPYPYGGTKKNKECWHVYQYSPSCGWYINTTYSNLEDRGVDRISNPKGQAVNWWA